MSTEDLLVVNDLPMWLRIEVNDQSCDCCSLSAPGGCGSAVSRCCRAALAACCLGAAGTPHLPVTSRRLRFSPACRRPCAAPRVSVCASREASQFFREPRVKQLKVSWNYFNSVWGRSTSSTSPSALPDLTSRLIVKVTDGTSANGNGTVLGVLRCAGACVGTVRCSQERGVVALVAGVAPSCCCCD